MQRLSKRSCQTCMRRYILVLLILLTACRRQTHCENATVYKSTRCGVDWEVQFGGQRYPVQNLSPDLLRDGNRIEIYRSHYYDDPRTCPCCGYRYLVVDGAEDDLICL